MNMSTFYHPDTREVVQTADLRTAQRLLKQGYRLKVKRPHIKNEGHDDRRKN